MQRLTKSQRAAFMLMLARAREEWYVASARKAKDPFATVVVPLTRYYACFNAKCRPWVLAAWDLFFERVTRGNQLTKKASSWIPRPEKAVLGLLSTDETYGAATMTKLSAIFHANRDTLVKIREHVYAKQEAGKPVTKLEVEFEWPDVETQELFERIAIEEWKRNPQAEWKNGKEA